MRTIGTIALFSITLILLAPDSAAGYVGPGTGLAIIGAAIAFIASLFLGILGFVWYPIKRAYAAIFKKGDPSSDEDAR